MNTIKRWLKDHSITTHSVASAWTLLCGYYAVSPDFQHQVSVAWAAAVAHTPAFIKPWVPIALGLYAWYRNGQKKEVQVSNPQSGSSQGK